MKRTASKPHIYWLWTLLLALLLPISVFSQNAYPVHVSVQALPPYGIYLTDYYSGSRDKLIVTLLNRDKDQRTLQIKLRVQIKNGSMFALRSRDELYYPMLTLESGIPLRLTGADLAAYLAPDKITMQGYLNQGKLPTGMTEFSVQAVDYVTGRTLSDYGTGRVWLETKQPPTLNLPLKDEQVAYKDPQHIRFQWMPRHQGLANTQYEFVLKQLPDNGAAPQSAFAYGQEIYRTETRFTTLNYTHLEPLLVPGKRYAWQVRAIAKDGIDEIGMFENNGYSEINWFELNDNCPAPTQVKATDNYRKIAFEWKGTPQQRAFLVEYRPKSSRNSYEWTSIRTFDTSYTAYDLREGWTYEYRIGALCMTEKPVYSPVQEITLSLENKALIENCGVMPIVDRSNQTPKEDLKVGDVVTIGGDHRLTITQLSSQGNGWYSGKGWMHLAWIFDINVAMKFERLRINTDNRQIDGTAESETDPNASQIANTNQLDYGGTKTIAGKVEFAVKKLDFTVPEAPIAEYNPEKEELIVFDTEGKPHIVEAKKNEGGSIFPMVIEDEEGNKYQINAPADASQPGESGAAGTGGKQQPIVTKIEDASTNFDPAKLTTDAPFSVRFLPGSGKYAFDAGREPWYQTSQLIKDYYRPLDNGYIAPWKLIPAGESDVVEAFIDGSGGDKKKIKFVLKDGKGVPAHEENGKWTLTLPSVKAGETYELLAVYEEKKNKTQLVGKLNVVSYAKQKQTVTLVPVKGSVPDTDWLETELNRIYSTYGVSITIKVDDALKGNTEWDIDGDSALNLNGSGFFSKETDEMKALRKLYQRTSPRYDRNAYYIFLTERAKAGNEPDVDLAVQGDMPRGKQFGYIFMQNAPNTPRLIAHELGHGIFTLRHTFEVNYSGDKFKSATTNLMDYNNGSELAVWQWNVMANPAPLTWFDSEDDAKSVETEVLITGQSAGIAPNGKIIISFKAQSPTYKVVPGIKSNSYFIHSLNLLDESNKQVKSYKWDSNKQNYYCGKEAIEKSTDFELTYNAAAIEVPATIYNLIGDHCFYHYAKVMHNSGSTVVKKPTANQWEEGLLFNADAECTNVFNREHILLKDRKGCTPAESEVEVTKLKAAINDKKEAAQLVTIINNVYLSSLRCLSYDEIVSAILTITSQTTLKDDAELAVIRLINAINRDRYAEFYRLLENNNNRLIKYLIDQIDDASVCFWYNDNYTNFIGALTTMFKSSEEAIVKTWPTKEKECIKRVVNLKPENYQKLADADHVVFSGRVNSGEYNSSTGNITAYEIFTTTNYNIQPDGSVKTQTTQRKELLAELSPLTPIMLVLDDSPFPLIETALDGSQQLDKNTYLVPAIFLKYGADKIKNHKIEVGTQVVLDLATIAASGPVAIAANAGKVRRIWAIMEVAGAIGDIGTATQTIDPNSKLRPAVDIYNATMGLIGLKNIGASTGKGVVKFTDNLDETMDFIKNNKSLRDKLVAGEMEWEVQTTNLGELSDIERSAKAEQEKVWKTVLNISSDAYVANPTYISIMDALRKKHPNKLRDVEKIGEVLKEIEINNLELLSKVEGFHKVLDDMTISWMKLRGGEFQLKYATRLVNEGKKISFEVNDMSNNLQRVYDIVIEGEGVNKGSHINLELKNWSKIISVVVGSQFPKDLAKMEKLGDFQWIFRSTKTNPFTPERLRTEFIAALRQKGVKKEIEKLFVDEAFSLKMTKIFKTDILNADDLIKAIEDENNFSRIIKIAEGL